MDESPIAAERVWYAVDVNGAEHVITLRVRVPVVQPGGEWGAVVSISELHDHPLSVFGDDQWQALQLAMRFATHRLAHHAEQGWQFSMERGGEPVSTSQLIAS